MPQVIAVVSAAAWDAAVALGASAEVAAVVSSVAVAATVATAAYGAARAVQALTPGLPTPDAGKFSVKQSVPPRRSGFGRCRIAGYFMCDEAKDTRLFQVIALHAGKIDGYEQFYAHDDKITLWDGVVLPMADGAFANGRVQIDSRLGEDVETAYAGLASEAPEIWSTDHRGDGIASLYVRQQNGKLKDFNKQFPNGPASITVVARLQRVFDWREAA
jgi:hypothetical protein